MSLNESQRVSMSLNEFLIQSFCNRERTQAVLNINSFSNLSANQKITGAILPNLFGYFYVMKHKSCPTCLFFLSPRSTRAYQFRYFFFAEAISLMLSYQPLIFVHQVFLCQYVSVLVLGRVPDYPKTRPDPQQFWDTRTTRNPTYLDRVLPDPQINYSRVPENRKKSETFVVFLVNFVVFFVKITFVSNVQQISSNQSQIH